jgi:hypothetical protein
MDASSRSLGDALLRSFTLSHQRLLSIAESLPPERFLKTSGPTLHSIAWQLWHAARWEDVFASYLHRALGHDPRAQVWEREGLAGRWSLETGGLGRRDTGTEMPDKAAEAMSFPGQAEVVAYAKSAFAFAEEAVAQITDDQLLVAPKLDPGGHTRLDNALTYLEHLSRHLGMIEAIRGLQDGDGQVGGQGIPESRPE